MKLCSKPGCPRPGAAILAYDYAARRALLLDPQEGELSPHLYALCLRCAEKLNPPRGWELFDERNSPPMFVDRESEMIHLETLQEVTVPVSGHQLFFGTSH